MTDKERIEVYVNELPKECSKCPLRCGNSCNLLKGTDYENMIGGNCRLYHCPLKTIQSAQNKRAVEALQKLKQDIWVDQYDDGYLDKQVDLYYLTDIIDQLIKDYGGEDNAN